MLCARVGVAGAHAAGILRGVTGSELGPWRAGGLDLVADAVETVED